MQDYRSNLVQVFKKIYFEHKIFLRYYIDKKYQLDAKT